MKSLLKLAIVASSVSLFTACGGGGGGGTTNPPVATAQVFQTKTALVNSFSSYSAAFTVSGTASGFAVTGSGTITQGSLTSGTFEGVAAQKQTTTITGTVTANSQTQPLASVTTSYADSNYLPLGSSGDEYTVVNGTPIFPATAVVNDTGTVFTATRYSNSTKSLKTGTTTVSFAIQPDTATTGLLKLISIYKDNSGTTTLTATQTIRITPAGQITRISEVAAYANGNNLTITYN